MFFLSLKGIICQTEFCNPLCDCNISTTTECDDCLYLLDDSANPLTNDLVCRPIQRQCLSIFVCSDGDDTLTLLRKALDSKCASTSSALQQVCGSQEYITGDTEEDCFSACSKTSEDSGNSTTQLLNDSECFEVEKLFCRGPQSGRTQMCVDRCVTRKHCVSSYCLFIISV